MGKRGNENAQLSKEEFEALESRGSSGAEAAGGFSRATPEEMSKRRIIRRAKKPTGSPAPPAGGGFGGPSSGGGGGGGVFSSINFGVPASDAPPSTSGKPKFAMPTVPEYTPQQTAPASSTSKKNPFGSINLAPSNTDTGSMEVGPKSTKGYQKFKEWGQNLGIGQTHELAVERYLTTMAPLLEEEKNKKTKDAPASTTGQSSANTAAPSTTAPSKPAGSLFSPAPAPVAFSFGAVPKPDAAPAAAPTFSFSSTAPAPAPAASSGFSFAPATSSTVPAPGLDVKIALSPVPAPSADTGGDAADDAQQPEEGKTELESADGDWNELMNVRVRAYHYRHEGGGAKKFASGGLKVQQSKTNSKIHRMVLRDTAGKVLLNVGISKGMSFTKTDQKAKAGSKPTASIMFVGVHDEDRGGEKFTLLSSLDDATKLHAKFQQLSS